MRRRYRDGHSQFGGQVGIRPSPYAISTEQPTHARDTSGKAADEESKRPGPPPLEGEADPAVCQTYKVKLLQTCKVKLSQTYRVKLSINASSTAGPYGPS
ncbi:hypothetical protein GCM10027280_09480 [Micromonospora polyrhachis]